MNHLALLFALPLLAAFLLPLLQRMSGLAGWLLGPLVLGVNVVLGLQAWDTVSAGPVVIELGGFRPPFGIVFYIDQLALLFAIAVSAGSLLLWPLRDGPGAPVAEYTLALVLAAAATGLALSADLFNLYVFYELTAVACYGLAAARGTPAGYAAVMRFVVVGSLGAGLMLAGIALVYMSAGTLNLAQLSQLAGTTLDGPLGLAAFVLILIGAGVKAELFPVNAWVPEVYGAASKRVAGLLAGVISKLALLIILRLLVLVFQQPEALQVMLVLGVLGVLSGELAAWRARDLTRLLAFSSIGQLGIIFIACSVPGEGALFAALAVALHHLLVKPALFLLAERWGGSIERLAGGSRSSPLGAALFVLLALSLIGVPPLPGFWAKLLVLVELAGQQQPLYYFALFAILAGVVLEAGYLFRVVAVLYRADAGQPPPAGHRLPDISVAAVLGGTLVAGTLLLAPLAEQLGGIATRAADVALIVETVNPGMLP
jgi:formate hydrogenlyase subunit 3/multisubunit Na+/H+ antiporter MnhD subunit